MRAVIFALLPLLTLTIMPEAALPRVQGEGTCSVKYSISIRGWAYSGAFLFARNVFTNVGSLKARITAVQFDASFGQSASSSGPGPETPLTLREGGEVEYDSPFFVPEGVLPGDYSTTGQAWFQCYDSNSTTWITPNSSPVAATSSVAISYGPRDLFLIIEVVAVLVVLGAATILVASWRRRNN